MQCRCHTKKPPGHISAARGHGRSAAYSMPTVPHFRQMPGASICHRERPPGTKCSPSIARGSDERASTIARRSDEFVTEHCHPDVRTLLVCYTFLLTAICIGLAG